ncbi:phage terminase large subunit [Hymenobacter sp. BT683]|uniref:Phage terminase large subunit n=1 Tax=Hymenobacter jeongseonensis TaxID=2791027 RepID=A0ABS0IGH8_9BACT|nr:phage terminase large subunit [Hymenobacter jeongseonensis]MBF9237457.1 phage terminase large subunit [Hymenobacter jeongseonensis]
MPINKDDLLITKVPKNKGGRPRKHPLPVKPVPSVNPDTLRVDVNRALYRKDFFAFYQDLFPNIKGEVFENNWHVKALCDDIQPDLERAATGKARLKHVDANIGPRTGKSFIYNVAAPLWFHLLMPKAEIVTVTNGSRLSGKMLGFTKKVIKSDWFKLHYPEMTLVVDNESGYEWSTGGKRTAFGIDSKILGENTDLTITDDLLDSPTATSDAERNNVLNKLMHDIFGRFNNKAVGLHINFNQRLHVQDVSGAIQAQLAEYFRVIKLPSEAKSSADVIPSEWFDRYTPEPGTGNRLLWDAPGRLSRPDLNFERARLGTNGYSQQHLQRPRSRDGGILKTKWFTDNTVTADEWKLKSQGRHVEYQVFLDGAETTNPLNDATCWALVGKLDNQVFVLDVQWRRLTLPDLKRSLAAWLDANRHGLYPATRVWIEGKSIGKSLISEMKELVPNVIFLELQPGRDSKAARCIGIESYVEGGRARILAGQPWTEEFIDECSSFTGKESGKRHDDALDTLIYAVRNAKEGDFFFAPI